MGALDAVEKRIKPTCRRSRQDGRWRLLVAGGSPRA
jgi:hypothetical protein